MIYGRLYSWLLMALLVATTPLDAFAAKQAIDKKSGTIKSEQQGLKIFAVPRKPENMAAFYEGRGLPQRAIKHLRNICFFTIGLRQQEQRIVWLEPARWQFRDQHGKLIKRYPREYWDDLWRKLKVGDGPRVTFGWVQLPNARDLRYQEPVGGMVMLEPTRGPITLMLDFRTNADKKGPPIRVTLKNLRCRFDEAKR